MRDIGVHSSQVTIRDVAMKAGVSIVTVSNVINKKGKVSSVTEERVMSAIKITNWSPNENSRKLARSNLQ